MTVGIGNRVELSSREKDRKPLTQVLIIVTSHKVFTIYLDSKGKVRKDYREIHNRKGKAVLCFTIVSMDVIIDVIGTSNGN